MTIINPNTGRSATQSIEVMTWEQVRQFLRFEELMKNLGLGVHCRFCTQAYGPPNDGIQLKIDDANKMLHIDCNHKSRKFHVKKEDQMKIVMAH